MSLQTNHNATQAELTKENISLSKVIRQLKFAAKQASRALKKQSLLEEETRQSKIRFETVFDKSTFGNKILNSELIIQKVNKALINLLGYTEEELLGKTIIEFSHPDFRQHWQLLQAKLWREELPSFSIDTCLITKDGTTIWCRVTSILFLDKASKLGYTVLEDITERKALETLHTEAAAKKDEFLNIVSHELKTPLTNIKALNQLLSKSVSKDQKYYPFIERSAKQITRLEKMMADLLDVTKINSGEVDLSIQEFDFNEALDYSVSSVQNISSTHQIIVETSVVVPYKGDRLRIEQVMINLLNNAIKYSPDANRVIVKAELQADNIVVSIQDFGIGIPKKDLNKLADRFYRVNETAMQYQGVGLGLYIASEILRKHDSKLQISSDLGKGSTFSFCLPLTLQDDESRQIA